MSRTTVRRGLLGLATALIAGVFGGAIPADGSTLYACVKKHGSAHLFGKKPKCHKGESKLTWNTPGPAGANGTSGANGKDGAPGTNGAVAGYFTGASGPLAMPLEKEITIASKKLPAGNYLITGKAVIEATAETAGLIGAGCELKVGATSLDNSFFDTSTAVLGGKLAFAVIPVTVVAAISPSTSTTVDLVCHNFFNVPAATVQAVNWGLLAVQTSSNS
jgi:hypothetical protein